MIPPIPPWWGIPLVVVVGAIVVWWGWHSDRRRHADAIAAAREPRPIPGLPADTTPPDYVEPPDAPLPHLDPEPDASALLAARPDTATLPAGAASGAFLNHADRGLAILANPHVLTLQDDLTSDRDVVTLLTEARRRGRPLVVVAPYFSDAVLQTLLANARTGKLRILPVPLDDERLRRKAVALTGGRLLSPSALASAWLPDECWGRCEGWISDLDDSWILPDKAPGSPPQAQPSTLT